MKSRSALTKEGASTKDDRKAVELDQAMVGRLTRIDAIQRQEIAIAQESRRLIEIKKINAALERLKVGKYGVCIRCEELISVKRLTFNPAIALCVNCANN